MANRAEDINDEQKSARSKADFIRLAGIGTELAEFLTEFVEKPDIFFQCLSKGAVKLKTRWTQFCLRLGNEKPFTTTPSTVTVSLAGWAIDLFLLQAIFGKGGDLWKSEAATVMKQTQAFRLIVTLVFLYELQLLSKERR